MTSPISKTCFTKREKKIHVHILTSDRWQSFICENCPSRSYWTGLRKICFTKNHFYLFFYSFFVVLDISYNITLSFLPKFSTSNWSLLPVLNPYDVGSLSNLKEKTSADNFKVVMIAFYNTINCYYVNFTYHR